MSNVVAATAMVSGSQLDWPQNAIHIDRVVYLVGLRDSCQSFVCTTSVKEWKVKCQRKGNGAGLPKS